MTDGDQILAANAAFYAAFAGRDFAAMIRIWADEDVSCIHPGWPPLVGRKAVLDSYKGLLSNPAQVRIDQSHEIVSTFENQARVLCIETVAESTLAATNLFRRINGVWRMTHHQASPIALNFPREERPPKSRLN